MFKNVFAENPIQRVIRKRPAASEIHQVVDVAISITIDINPVLIGQAPWATAKIATKTIERKSRINQHVNGNTRCAGSNPQGKTSGFFLCMAQSTISSALDDFCYPLAIIARDARRPLQPGVR